MESQYEHVHKVIHGGRLEAMMGVRCVFSHFWCLVQNKWPFGVIMIWTSKYSMLTLVKLEMILYGHKHELLDSIVRFVVVDSRLAVT